MAEKRNLCQGVRSLHKDFLFQAFQGCQITNVQMHTKFIKFRVNEAANYYYVLVINQQGFLSIYYLDLTTVQILQHGFNCKSSKLSFN